MHDTALPTSLPLDPGLSSEFHCWPLPGYLWPALERRCQSIFCTEPHLRIHGALNSDIEAWVQRQEGRISGLWLFRRFGCKARVINEVVDARPSDIERLAEALFARYRELDVIELHALHLLPDLSAVGQAESGPRWQRWQRATVSEDFVLELPASIEAWHASLSARTREKLRQCLRRARRSEPGLHFRLQHDADISESQVHAVLQMSRARMRAKGRTYGMDAREERALCALMRERGQLATIEIDGQVRAGMLCTLAGNDLYMHVITHDPAFDELRLGYLCCVLTIEAAITQRRRRFHFLWGWYDYKTRLGGQRRALEHVLLWRSWQAVCRHPLLFVHQQWLQLKATLRQRRLLHQQAQARQAARAAHHPPAVQKSFTQGAADVH